MSMTIGLLLLRLVVGLVMAGHGMQKLFGWFGGNGWTSTAVFWGARDSSQRDSGRCWLELVNCSVDCSWL